MAEYIVQHGHASNKNGRTPEYRAWTGMIQKCTNARNPKFKHFGGSGVLVCNEWRGPGGFAAFLGDVGNRPSKSHCLERRDLSKGFCSGNCFWALPAERKGNGKYHGHAARGSKPPEYHAWMNMKSRCLNPKNERYPRYGGRGIVICAEWLGPKGFPNFFRDMGEKPTPSHQIDRKDTDGNYSKENCHWATPVQQMNNTSRNIFVSLDGERVGLAMWCKANNMSYTTVYSRLRKGWTLEEALTPRVLDKWSRRGHAQIHTR